VAASSVQAATRNSTHIHRLARHEIYLCPLHYAQQVTTRAEKQIENIVDLSAVCLPLINFDSERSKKSLIKNFDQL
jgi:hypothetical protein